MLSMKTLRVAFAAAAAALLLGSGLASATVQHLDGTRAAGTAFTPLAYAQELLNAGTNMTEIMAPHDAHKLVADLGERIESDNGEAYIHLRLQGGMQFSEAATDLSWYAGALLGDAYVCPDGSTMEDVSGDAYLDGTGVMVDVVHISGGSEGSTSVIYRIDADGTNLSGNPFNEDGGGNGIPATLSDQDGGECDKSGFPTRIWVDVDGFLEIPSGTGSYGASLTLETRDTRTLGQATIVQSVNGIDVKVEPNLAVPAVADVGTGFLRFFNGVDRPTVSKRILGTATADMANDLPGGAVLLHPRTGDSVVKSNLLPNGSLSFTVKGDLSFGAFNLSDPMERPADPCERVGSPDAAPIVGNLKPAEGNTGMATLAAQNAGSYELCVQVDTMGPGSNTTPIPAGAYTATITSVLNGRPLDLTANRPIGRITRNGAAVHIAYLTTSEKQRQRVIVVNRGPQPIRIMGYKFQSEDGTMVELTAAAMAAQEAGAMIGPGETVVRQVRDMINITGDSRRTAVTMHFNAVSDHVSVATTQVNVENSSTDTVMWPVKDG